jgi:glutathione S-transferase
MTDEIVFYHNPQSRSQMVRWMIEEAGALLDKMMKRPEVERQAAVGWGSYDDVLATPPGLKGEAIIDAYLARLTARPAFQRSMAG